jgi:hypothetical protein
MKILREQIEFIRSPKSVLLRLERDPRHPQVGVGLKHVLTLAILYEIAILLWAFGTTKVTLPPFLKIPEEHYYFYELAFLIPLFIITWLLASAMAYLLSKVMGGNGSFDAILGGFGLTMAVSAYFTLIPDYIQGILWTAGWIPFNEYQELTSKGVLLIIVRTYMLAYILAHVLLYSATIRQTQKLSRTKSVIVALVSFIGSFAVWITYVR